jgi:5-methylcytosine-specific restriction endonuclease McrA
MNGREFHDISDDELEATLGRLLGAGARLEARIVAHLAEIEERRVHLLAGYSSLYDYCRKRLALSDYEAFARIAAARVARKYPLIFEMLEQRKLHLTAICEVREFLTAENHRELRAEVSGQSKLQVREILARRFPRADVRASLKKLPELDPLSPGRYRLLLTLNAEQKEKVDLARALLSHANPAGDLAVVVERALDALIAQLEKRRFGQREPRDSAGVIARSHAKPDEAKSDEAKSDEAKSDEAKSDESRHSPMLACASRSVEIDKAEGRSTRRKHIPNVVRRELVARDGARCSFISEGGKCCEERGFLQFHHRHPWARGGADTLENLALLCHAHNRLLAERDFGKTQVQAAIDPFSASPHERTPHLGQPKRAG